MKQLYYDCLIRRDAVETGSRSAASSEVPVLQAVYGDALVLGNTFTAERATTTPAEEYERLVARYGPEAVTAAYGTRVSGEREIAALFKDGAKAASAGAGPGSERADSADPFLARKSDEIIPEVPEQSDEALAAYLEAEKLAKKPRKGVLEAIEAEIQKRVDEDNEPD